MDYKDFWNEVFQEALEAGLKVHTAEAKAYKEAQEWYERQQAKAEAMEER